VQQAVEAACLGDFVASLPEGIDTRIGESGGRMSGVQKQRLGIARALYKNAEVLFFDEATSALDSATEREINTSIRQLSETHTEITIIIIAHRESSLAFCDRIIEIGK
jgi:ABC-type multidrug transport system fused ATPase/permease subunit